MHRTLYLTTLTLFLFATFTFAAQTRAADWKPAELRLATRWTKDVSPETAWQEYPRPQMVRSKWTNLNGLWQYAIAPRDADTPTQWDGEILVPFAVESALSGVQKPVSPDQRLWYRRTFAKPMLPKGQRLLLHFGAVDWEATVWVNGKQVGEHRGGYDPFSFDITDALNDEEQQEVTVAVWDPTDSSYQPRGKQVLKPHGIWYTAVTGIWQTVWLEPVPATRIESLKIVPDVKNSVVRVTTNAVGDTKNCQVIIHVTGKPGRQPVRLATTGDPGVELAVAIPDARLWSPSDPYLYDMEIELRNLPQNNKLVDKVTSYCGLREITFAKDAQDANRLHLNGKPIFMFGPLDQGWWPDGLYTAPTDEALASDIQLTKNLGFNMLRKHVKVEPARFYYHCDRLGMLVWQDMPNGDKHIRPEDPDIERSTESEENFRREYEALVNGLRNHPSIVVWVPFNEGWGQFKTNDILAWAKELDPTRLIDGPSGWTDRGEGELHDVHKYPGPEMPPLSENRVAVLGEFGGLGLPLEEHLWGSDRNWGYRTYKTPQELHTHYAELIKLLKPLVEKGLAAAIYTQTTDVEGEVNGLATYDREVIKFDMEKLKEMHAEIYEAGQR
ncbi:MAG: sugar-binding domain-containing protein [Pirellulales bacterium]